MTPKRSEVLPAYREALALQQLLPALISSIAPLTCSYEILVIGCDGAAR